ncbi:hypothetical protein DFH07DRAFT_563576 [Mycena maculata]|uniref:Uncharacterized protein n=1 Tax=Mycena maculata TaxID=230809 RepID=A0AAD7IQQ6_9AGAR|nr:hypothetical protein DFH07DRAFT_563576 [Mycena maculata]
MSTRSTDLPWTVDTHTLELSTAKFCPMIDFHDLGTSLCATDSDGEVLEQGPALVARKLDLGSWMLVLQTSWTQGPRTGTELIFHALSLASLLPMRRPKDLCRISSTSIFRFGGCAADRGPRSRFLAVYDHPQQMNVTSAVLNSKPIVPRIEPQQDFKSIGRASWAPPEVAQDRRQQKIPTLIQKRQCERDLQSHALQAQEPRATSP